jgi:HK97 family phage prohead protease
MERFAPNAWKKTIKERGDKIRSLFQHGRDPQIGDKPLGPFHRLEEDDQGGYAEVKLLDTSYNRDLLPGLKEGLYGASHASVSSRRKRTTTRSAATTTRTGSRKSRSGRPGSTSSGR